MATRRFMINYGQTSKDVTQAVGAATVTKQMEVTIDLTAGFHKGDVMKSLEEIKQYIKANNWPPA